MSFIILLIFMTSFQSWKSLIFPECNLTFFFYIGSFYNFHVLYYSKSLKMHDYRNSCKRKFSVALKKNVKIEIELWCNPPAIKYDSLCSVQSMLSSCTTQCLLRKKVSHTWKQILVSSENEKHVKRIFSERVIPSKIRTTKRIQHFTASQIH